MSFSSVLQTIGKDVKSVFTWIGSAQGQKDIQLGEAAVETAFPVTTGFFAIANTILAETMKIEALAAAAGTQNGTGAQKAIAVVTSVTPAVLNYAKANGLPTPTATQIQAAVNAMVAFGNALEGPSAIGTTAA